MALEILQFKTIIAAAILAAALPAAAATSLFIQPLRDDDAGAVNACTGTAGGLTDRLCQDGRRIGTDFGSTTNLTVALSIANNSGPQWARFSDAGGFREISITNGVDNIWSLTPAAGFEIRVVGFDQRRRSATGGLVPTYDLTDVATNTSIWSLTTASFIGSQAISVNSGWFGNELRFTWSNQGGGSLGIRNFALDIRPAAASPPAAIPEPASWAMMIVGFGLVGSAARRRVARASAIAA